MDKNEIYYEITTIHNLFLYETTQYGDPLYSRAHMLYADWYRDITDQLNSVIGFNGGSDIELKSYLSSMQLTNEQKKKIWEIRKTPIFKKIMGESALKLKPELETLLGKRITSDGITVLFENEAKVSVKDEDTLWEEHDLNSNKLEELLASGRITKEQYQNYDMALGYIYGYFVSQSKGEQIPLRKISDKEYEKIELLSVENHISPSEQLTEETQEMLEEFQEVQEIALSSKTTGRKK